jgi:uncharacterized membrane protein YdfJ with MMPL/SSD domain
MEFREENDNPPPPVLVLSQPVDTTSVGVQQQVEDGPPLPRLASMPHLWTRYHQLMRNLMDHDDNDDDDDEDDGSNHHHHNNEEDSSVDDRYNTCIQRFRYGIIWFVFLVIWPTGMVSYHSWTNDTESTFHHAIPGTPSALAQDAFVHAFRRNNNNNNSSSYFFLDPMNPPLFLILSPISNTTSLLIHDVPPTIQTNSTSTITPAYQQARNFSLQLVPFLQQRRWKNTGFIISNSLLSLLPSIHSSSSIGHNNNSNCHRINNETESWLRITSYYTYLQPEIQQFLPSIADASFRIGTSVLIQIEYDILFPTNETTTLRRHEKKKRLLHELMRAVDEYQTEFWKNQTRIAAASTTGNPSSDEDAATTTTTTTSNASTPSSAAPWFHVSYTGIPYLASDLAASTRRDIRRMDVLVLPLAWLCMGVVLKGTNPWIVWIVPLLTTITTVCAWSIIMNILMGRRLLSSSISTFTPTVMMSLSLGMGIDYTMFLLARYMEEMETLGDVRKRKKAVFVMLRGSGHVIILSGLTLAATFAGLCCLPLDMLHSIGIGAVTTILSAIGVNLTLVPALLYTPLGRWMIITKSSTRTSDSRHTVESSTNAFSANNPLMENLLEDDPSLGESSHHNNHNLALLPHPRRSIWIKMSGQLLHRYRGVIILLVLLQLLFPIAEHATRIKTSISFDLLLPAKSPSLQTFHSLSQHAGSGSLNPYRLLFDGSDVNMTMTSAAGFHVMHLVIDELRAIEKADTDRMLNVPQGVDIPVSEIAEMPMALFDSANWRNMMTHLEAVLYATPHHAATFNGISVLKNVKVSYALYRTAKYCSSFQVPQCPFETLRVINELDQRTTSQVDKFATFISVNLGVDPFSDEGIFWLKQARSVIRHLEDNGSLMGVRVFIVGSAGIAQDTVEAVYDAFPWMIVVTTLTVFILMGIFFRSILVPFRSVVSIFLTLSFSFGLAVLVFQNGLFDWTHIQAFSLESGELCWLVPLMGFSIIVGLALDYDVFLISRILEFRLDEHEHKTSIAKGLEATGGVVTAAGAIMAIAFGSLMLSSNPVLFQWSFLLTSAVLLDTFIIRTMVVPVLTDLAGSRCCWWPRKLPEERVCFPEFDRREVEDVAGLLRSLESTSEYEPLRQQ